MSDASGDPESTALVVSGFGGGGLFVLHGGEVERLDVLDSTGLAHDGARLGRLLRAGDGHDSVSELLVYDRRGVVEYRRLDGVADPHDLAAAPDGGWLVVSSASNSVQHLGADGRISTVWQPSTVHDAWHPNCITAVDGNLWVSLFGRFGATRAWAGDEGRGAGLLLDLSTGRELGGLSHPHSPRRLPGSWVVCDSLSGTIVQRDDDTEQWHVVAETGGYPRGLVVQGDRAFVGVSAPRGSDERRSTVRVLDGWQEVDRVTVPCAEIYDIREVPVALVEGVRRGFDTNLERVAASRSRDLMELTGRDPALDRLGQALVPSEVSVTVSAALPRLVSAGERFDLEVSYTNHGRWTLATVPPVPVMASSRWLRAGAAQIDGPRCPLREPLWPRATVTQPVPLVAPDAPGTYELRLSLVQDGVMWFDDADPSAAAVGAVEVSR